MCIDNFDTWFEVMQVKSKEESLYAGTTKIHKSIFMDQLKDKFEECWNNAFQAGKEDRDEEVEELKEQIKDLETDNYEWEEHCNHLEEELEDAQQ